MNIDKNDLTNCIEQIVTEAVIEGEEVEVTASRIVKFVWPIIEYLKKNDPVVMPTEECVKHKPEPDFTDEDILDEMEADMNQWGVAQGEIESMRQDWRNRFLIVRRER